MSPDLWDPPLNDGMPQWPTLTDLTGSKTLTLQKIEFKIYEISSDKKCRSANLRGHGGGWQTRGPTAGAAERPGATAGGTPPGRGTAPRTRSWPRRRAAAPCHCPATARATLRYFDLIQREVQNDPSMRPHNWVHVLHHIDVHMCQCECNAHEN